MSEELKQVRLYHPTVHKKGKLVYANNSLSARLDAAFRSVPGNTWADKIVHLNKCDCCERHPKDKPKIFGPSIELPSRKHLRDDLDTVKQCPCNCRHLARQICRQHGVSLPPLDLPEIPRTPADQNAVEAEFAQATVRPKLGCPENDEGWYQGPKPWEAGYQGPPTKTSLDGKEYTKQEFLDFFGNLDLWYELGYDHEVTKSASALTGGCKECEGRGADIPGCSHCGLWNAAAHAQADEYNAASEQFRAGFAWPRSKL